jgi:hypothetical protein
MDPIASFALAAGLSWASGIRLYAVLFICGALHALGWVELPSSLRTLANPTVLWVSGSLVVAEFLADKVPVFDSLWDAIHTFIRIPAGALLAVGAFGPGDAPQAIAAALLGGTLAGGSHFTKSASRVLINTSPEPVSNWTASFGEDAMTPVIVLLALHYPIVLLGLLVIFLGLVLWLAPKLIRGIQLFIDRLRGMRPRSPQ